MSLERVYVRTTVSTSTFEKGGAKPFAQLFLKVDVEPNILLHS